MIRRLQRGHSPNCSATGSVVGLALVSAAVAAALLNAWADRLSSVLPDDSEDPGGAGGGSRGGGPDNTDGDREDGGGRDAGGSGDPDSNDVEAHQLRVRLEADRALVAWPEPPALLEVEPAVGAQLLAAGAQAMPATSGPPAPTEVHLAVSGRCPAPCRTCYLDTQRDGAPASFEALRRTVDELATQGIFEIAFGGGEVDRADLDALVSLAAHARARGIVPNLTTSGFAVSPATAPAFRVFGQVNVSLDGLDSYGAVRGWDGSRMALAAIEYLVDAGVRVGVNTVLCRDNVHELEQIAFELDRRCVSEWQWLRLKPAGRAQEDYAERRLDASQATALHARAVAIEARHGLSVRFDCAMTPFLVHDLDVERLRALGIAGCQGGRALWSRHADGGWAPCSFRPGSPLRADLATAWSEDSELQRWREHAERTCASCDARAVCGGGCRVVAHHAGDRFQPDPECPRVLAAR